tara:strand:- start:3908 stop:4051 length:144 start_codon:yes stop_codon:yes gene_type:complete
MEKELDDLYKKYKVYGYITDEDVDRVKKIYNNLHPNLNPIKYVQTTT